ncbi:YciI family protein [Microbacterium sp. NPDC056044]|uniref:YciI family protein n=1 Tax=Microbacterium sp. NPDC056044 TaxID=3345690 RepID=UPI0035DB3D51
MRYMLIMQVEAEAAAAFDPETFDMAETFATMGRYNEELQRAGVFLSAEGLSDASEGFRVDFDRFPRR